MLFAVSGCLGNSSNNIENVEVENWNAEPQTLTIIVNVDGNQQLSREVSVRGSTDTDGSKQAGRETIDEELPGPSFLSDRQYQVVVKIDRGATKTMEKTLSRDLDTLKIVIGEEGSVNIFFEKAV